jgi:phage-related baseplate assembly protein
MADKIQFITLDPDGVVASLVTKYELLTGRTLQPAQVERIVFNAIGYRISLVEQAINETANQCFVAFANGQALEELGRPLGVYRLPASVATCTLRLTLVSGHGDLSIPSGLRVQSTDGQVVFKTTETKDVLAGDDEVDIKAECTLEGEVGNGYAPGTITVILDPQPYLVSATNLDETANGGDAETDDELRQRIFLAPDSFSVAGPKGAYKFFAKSAHPNIVDVAVTIGHDLDAGPVDDLPNVIPGQVDIFPLMEDGDPPDQEIIDAIMAICNDEKVRPLTDTVVVKAPTKLEYAIAVDLLLLPTAVQVDIVALVTANLEAYRDARKHKLGIDVVISQIVAACMVLGVYKTTVTSPVADVVAKANEFTSCTGITVNVTGTHDA